MKCGTHISATSDGNVILLQGMQQVTLKVWAEIHVCRSLYTKFSFFVSCFNQNWNFSMILGETL